MNEKDGVLFFNDTKGECRACLNVNEKSSSLYCCDANGECHGGFGVYEDGKVGPRFSAAQKDRDIKLGAGNDGNLYFMLTDEGAPMLGLRLDEGENKETFSDLLLIDRDGRAGVVVSNAGGSDPHLRLVDRRQKVPRVFFGPWDRRSAQAIRCR